MMIRSTQATIFPFLLLLMSFFLASCSSHVKRNDGPPSFYVDETKIPNAYPRPERLAKIGNKPSYVVFGKRYYVMRSSNNYSQVGIASWYGTKFHRRNTSSGEPYNMLAMTAAHKSLPLPTYVEVTNLKNHRKIIVRVNDRGPFESNRLIDLSYVAAKKLGMLGHGTAPVRVTAIDPYRYCRGQRLILASKRQYKPMPKQLATSWKVVRRTTRPAPVDAVYLQVGAFKNRMNAIKLQHRLSSLLHTPVIVTLPHGRENYFRVKIGPFRDIAAANKLTTKLKSLGIAANRSYGV